MSATGGGDVADKALRLEAALSMVGPGPILIASDIDGTLLVTGQPPSSAVLDAVSAARDLGVTDGSIVASNGAVTAELTGGSYRLTQVHQVDAQTVVHLATSIRPYLRIAAEIVGVGYHVTEPFPAGELNGDQVAVAHLRDLWAEPTPRMVLCGTGAHHLVSALRDTGITAIATRSDWVDATPGAVSKATAIEHLRCNLDIPVERTVAIGDGENDIELLQWAWRGVSMGHAPTQVKDAADETTGTINDDGVAQVLRSLLTTGAAPSPTAGTEVFQP